jgi:hypothetical protein
MLTILARIMTPVPATLPGFYGAGILAGIGPMQLLTSDPANANIDLQVIDLQVIDLIDQAPLKDRTAFAKKALDACNTAP